MDPSKLVKALETLKAFGFSLSKQTGMEGGTSEERIPYGIPIDTMEMLHALHQINPNRVRSGNIEGTGTLSDKSNRINVVEFNSNQERMGVIEPCNTDNTREERGNPNGRPRSFTEAITSGESAVPIKSILLPHFEGGNIIVKVDEEDYEKRVRECQFDVIGRILLYRGDKPYSTLELFDKLVIQWGIKNFRIVPMGKGFFHCFLNTMDNQSKVLSLGH